MLKQNKTTWFVFFLFLELSDFNLNTYESYVLMQRYVFITKVHVSSAFMIAITFGNKKQNKSIVYPIDSFW